MRFFLNHSAETALVQLTLSLHPASCHSSSFILLPQHHSPLSPWNTFFFGYWNTSISWFSSNPSIYFFSVSLLILPPISKLQMLEWLGSEPPSVLYLDTLPSLMAYSLMVLNITHKPIPLKFTSPHWILPWAPDSYMKPHSLALCLEA